MYCSTIHTSDTEHLVIEGIESLYLSNCGPGSPVGIATDYRLDGRGSIPGGDEIFLPYALVSTQPNENGYRVFLRVKLWPGHAADHSPPSFATVNEE